MIFWTKKSKAKIGIVATIKVGVKTIKANEFTSEQSQLLEELARAASKDREIGGLSFLYRMLRLRGVYYANESPHGINDMSRTQVQGLCQELRQYGARCAIYCRAGGTHEVSVADRYKAITNRLEEAFGLPTTQPQPN